MPGFRASGSAGLMMIALTPWAISERMSASWPLASVSWWMMVTFVTSPVLTASAFAEQSIASRQPFPTPPGFENPIEYAFAPPPEAPGEAVPVQAPARIASVATATRPRASPSRFMNSPPLADGVPT